MVENDYAMMDIAAYRYVPVGKNLTRTSLEDATIRVCHNVMGNYFVATCRCGLMAIFGEAEYRMGLIINGGSDADQLHIGVEFGSGHRWIRLYCGNCSEVQWYFREDELGAQM